MSVKYMPPYTPLLYSKTGVYNWDVPVSPTPISPTPVSPMICPVSPTPVSPTPILPTPEMFTIPVSPTHSIQMNNKNVVLNHDMHLTCLNIYANTL